ncbi:hypothetical protein OVA24_08320 [Luteolibacter sp. SL250]|uniref:hypothetical protein n=1 Tax=Luteolibacter sp. SL250 TaxID=2995170 RepID=UPI002271BF99|nr:hypothetical protein [Luteolibacter sp. SL250]WAC21390.1 hypothetical protein OVA24_08320 [Luteolibacter sp. SL250]
MHRWHLLLIPFLLLGACGGISSSSSGNQMLLVRESTGSAGYRKLMDRSRQCGDLRIFIDQQGLPDFLAEANSGDKDYLIFYYLDRHQAYACRTKGKGGTTIEFAGPYAMTKGEWKLLSGVKSRAETGAGVP